VLLVISCAVLQVHEAIDFIKKIEDSLEIPIRAEPLHHNHKPSH
jgi:hypothetical protein